MYDNPLCIKNTLFGDYHKIQNNSLFDVEVLSTIAKSRMFIYK